MIFSYTTIISYMWLELEDSEIIGR